MLRSDNRIGKNTERFRSYMGVTVKSDFPNSASYYSLSYFFYTLIGKTIVSKT